MSGVGAAAAEGGGATAAAAAVDGGATAATNLCVECVECWEGGDMNFGDDDRSIDRDSREFKTASATTTCEFIRLCSLRAACGIDSTYGINRRRSVVP